MNKRIKKKVSIRKCQKSLEKMKQIFHDADEEFLQGMENMYARRIAACRCCSRRSAIETSPFMASVIFLSFFFLIRLFMVGVLLQIAFADFVVVKYFVRLHKGGSAP